RTTDEKDTLPTLFPCAAAPFRYRAQVHHRSSGHINDLQEVAGEETNLVTVRRPERIRGPLGSWQWHESRAVKRAQRQHTGTAAVRADNRDVSAIRRNRRRAI